MMRLWNRKTENAPNSQTQQPPPLPLPPANSVKRRLKETNSIEDAKEVIRSPKPSAKAKKIDDQTQSTKRFSQLVPNHPFESATVNHRGGQQDKRGTYRAARLYSQK